MEKEELAALLFPHDQARAVQKDMIKAVKDVLEQRKHLIIHAPTGLGKTAAALSPALSYALKHDKTVFFLTSRHTQHIIAIETLKAIQERYGVSFQVADIIGKKWMCLQRNIEKLSSGDFVEYCKALRQDNLCDYYLKTRKNGSLTVEAKKQLEAKEIVHAEMLKDICSVAQLCPYEIALETAKKANVIVTDYYYLFHPTISENFFEKIGKKIEDAIIIIDEGHNLGPRLRELQTDRLSSFIMKQAMKEAKEMGCEELLPLLSQLQDILNEYAQELQPGQEKSIEKDDFLASVQKIGYQKLVDDCDYYSSMVRENKKKSYLGSISAFLKAWSGEDDGFARIISYQETKFGPLLTLHYKCLDPSLLAAPVLEQCHSAILMSGTLAPTEMYRDLLGFPERTKEATLESPFATENKMSLIVPGVTTKFTRRSNAEYEKLAKALAAIANAVPGNTAAFFPSYHLLGQVLERFKGLCQKTIIIEQQGFNKEEKTGLLEKFKRYQKAGAVLLGATSGSFGEGIDLPGDLLKCVVVVGLPLSKPSLETQQLIQYYQEKFGRGWDYGYVLPALTKVLQNAGRCIRSETDRGVIVFLDERYAWPSYSRCFTEGEVEITREYEEKIKEFFGKTKG